MIADVINKAERVVILTDILPRKGNDLEEVLKTHLALKQLVSAKKVNALITENDDGIHRFAGFAPQTLFELNGNKFTEYCYQCGT